MTQNAAHPRTRGAHSSRQNDLNSVIRPPVDVNPLLDGLVDLIVARVLQQLRGQVGSDWIDQTSSPLGRRRHCATVRRRLEQSLPGAAIVERAHRLTREALDEELAALSQAHVPTRIETECPGVTDELTRELRAAGGGR
jgi:hypothetical protein